MYVDEFETRIQGAHLDRPRIERDSLGVGLAVLVGEAPSKSERDCVLGGKSGRHLAKLAGLPFQHYLDFFDRVNLLPMVKVRSRASYPQPEARMAMQNLLPFLTGSIVILLGVNVARAFEAHCCLPTPVQRFRWYSTRNGMTAAFIPHPSRKSTVWHNRQIVEDAKKFLRALVVEERQCAKDRYQRFLRGDV